MTKLTNKFYGASLIALAFSLNAVNVNAQTCTDAPSCATLGFTKSSSECSGHSILKCPFDQTKVYCDTGSGSTTPTTPSCPTGYLTYDVLYPSCDETDRAKMEEHSSSKGCYKCKKCSDGYWFNPGSCWGSTHSDSAGCKACIECLDSQASPINGRCP